MANKSRELKSRIKILEGNINPAKQDAIEETVKIAELENCNHHLEARKMNL